jgi:hypothetical protein
LLVGRLAPVELGLDEDARAHCEVLGTGPRLRAVDLDGEVVGLVDLLLAAAPGWRRREPRTAPQLPVRATAQKPC